jgi:hypothetical protein
MSRRLCRELAFGGSFAFSGVTGPASSSLRSIGPESIGAIMGDAWANMGDAWAMHGRCMGDAWANMGDAWAIMGIG